MIKNLTLSVLATSILLGCAAPPPQFALPSGTSSATLKSALFGASSRNESLDIYISDGDCDAKGKSKLFSIKGSSSTPEGLIKVPANKPLRIDYDEVISGGRTCKISVYVALEEGKNYSLVGGFASKPGLIPILTDTRMCSLGIRNEDASVLVPTQKSCTPN
jgi:hypothetical protein